MTVASSPISSGDEQHLLLEDVSWEFYEHLLHEIGDRPLRVTFDGGSLEVMSPLNEHETWKTWIGFMVEALSVELDIPIRPLGSSTFRRKDLLKGLEPDECYYVQHAPDLAGKAQVDLAVDPPPDLAIEIEVTRRSIKRHPIYSALGIPELWTFGKSRLRVFHLSHGGKYREATTSKAFPFLPMDQFEAFLLRLGTERPTVVLREYRNWLSTLKP